VFDDLKLRSETITVEEPTENERRRAAGTITALATRAVRRATPEAANPDAEIRTLVTDTLAMLGLVDLPAEYNAPHGTVARADTGCACGPCGKVAERRAS